MPERTAIKQIPRFLTSFVGRLQELRELSTNIAPDSTNRLVTVTGAGGCGKTRLATEAALAIGQQYDGAVYFVELGEVVAGSAIEQAVFDALGLQEFTDVARDEIIARFLEKQPALLVLDNCEHVIESVRRLVSFLLHRSASIHLLCTSRELLGICGEIPLAIQPLSLPSAAELAALDLNDGAELFDNGAVRLFYDRARSVRPDFRITGENLFAVVRLCGLLDGLPLAIELAAARVRNFTPAEIAAHLEGEGFSLLALRYSAIIRHQTLDNAIAWSAEVLPEQERLLFQRLAVFRGGWHLAAAEAVCCDELLPANLLLTTLGNLVDKSLVITDQYSSRTRCRMLGTIHGYAERKLRQSAEYAEIVRRHKQWVQLHSEAAARGLVSKDSVTWMSLLDEESENYAAALRMAIDDDIEYVSHVVVNISQYWVRRQRISEIMRWTNAVLLHRDAEAHPGACGRAHYTRGRMNVWLMRYYDSAHHYSEATRLALAAGETKLLTMSRVSSLHSLSNAERMDEALEALRNLESDGYAPNEPWAVANYALARGLLAAARQEYVAALNLLDQGVRGLRILGESYLLAIGLYQVGVAAQLAGELSTSRGYLEESNQRAVALGFHNLVLRTQMRLAELYSAMGDLPTALDAFDKVIDTLKGAGESPTAHIARSFANIAVDANCMEPALLLYGAADARQENEHRITTTATVFHTPRIARARAALSAGAALHVWELGARLGLEDALAQARRQLRDPGAQAEWTRPHALVVCVLGPLRVRLRGETISKRAGKTSKARELLALLAVRGAMSREKIEEALWSEKERAAIDEGKTDRIDKIDNLFGATLSYLRAALGSSDSILLEEGRYLINPALEVSLDLDDFLRLKTAATEHTAYDSRHAVALLEDALLLVRGAFLEGLHGGDWIDSERALFEDRYCELLRNLGELSLERSDYTRAEFAFGRMLEIECMSEAAYRGLMRCHAARGDQVRLIRAYQQMETLLGNEFGARPSPESVALYQRLFASFEVESLPIPTALEHS